jgi:hypothetical protein
VGSRPLPTTEKGAGAAQSEAKAMRQCTAHLSRTSSLSYPARTRRLHNPHSKPSGCLARCNLDPSFFWEGRCTGCGAHSPREEAEYRVAQLSLFTPRCLFSARPRASTPPPSPPPPTPLDFTADARPSLGHCKRLELNDATRHWKRTAHFDTLYRTPFTDRAR